MAWLPALCAFAVWIAYGAVQARRWQALRARMQRLGQGARKALAPVLMFGGAAVMFAGLAALGSLGRPGAPMSAWQWLGVTLLGLGFVHAQTIATLMIISLIGEAETGGGPGAFQGKKTDDATTPAPR